MSATTYDRSNIPSETDIPERNTSRWRIADGQFRRGREIEGTLVSREPNRIVGIVTGFRVFSGNFDDGKPFTQLEVDVLTAEGMEYFKVNKNIKEGWWPTQGVGLAKYLTEIKEGRTYIFEPQLAAKKNSFGSQNTFMDVSLWNETTRKAEMIQTEYDGQKFKDIADDVFEKLESHPLYKEREQEKAESEKTEKDWFLEMLEAKSWPAYEGNEAAYVEALNTELLKAENGAIAVEDMDDDYFNFARQAWDQVNECPIGKAEPAKAEVKKPGLKKPSATPISDGETNPFKDD